MIQNIFKSLGFGRRQAGAQEPDSCADELQFDNASAKPTDQMQRIRDDSGESDALMIPERSGSSPIDQIIGLYIKYPELMPLEGSDRRRAESILSAAFEKAEWNHLKSAIVQIKLADVDIRTSSKFTIQLQIPSGFFYHHNDHAKLDYWRDKNRESNVRPFIRALAGRFKSERVIWWDYSHRKDILYIRVQVKSNVV